VNLKKTVLSALLLAVAATVAGAQTLPPRTDKAYFCNYTNPTMGESTPYGASRFALTGTPTLLRGIETFLVNYGTGIDQRKVTFAKPHDLTYQLPGGGTALFGTRWEFTINPSGPQCTSALVQEGGNRITFSQCSDGHSRVCTTYFQ